MHFDAGYVPRTHSVESFAQAIRAIGEPIHDRTAEDVSMAKLLMLLFEVTGLFDMRTRPELLLLQKTMVVVEGVARSLDPHLDMWAPPIRWCANGSSVNLGPSASWRTSPQAPARSAVSWRRCRACSRAAPRLLDQFDDLTRNGLVLSPESVEAIGRAEARRNRWDAGGAVGDRGAAWP